MALYSIFVSTLWVSAIWIIFSGTPFVGGDLFWWAGGGGACVHPAVNLLPTEWPANIFCGPWHSLPLHKLVPGTPRQVRLNQNKLASFCQSSGMPQQVLWPEPVFVDLLGSPGIDSSLAGRYDNPLFPYRQAGLHSLAELIYRNRFLGSIS